MFCEKCGAEIVDKDSKFCSRCGALISTSDNEKKPKNNSNIKKGKKIPIKTVIILVVVIAIISCAIYMYLDQTTRTSEVKSTFEGHYHGNEGTDFTIHAFVYNENIFGHVALDNQEINITVKNDAGEIVRQTTIKEDERYTLDNLPVGHYTVELSYTGEYPSANETRDFTIITPEDYAQKDTAEKQKDLDNLRQFNQMYHAAVGY